MMLPIRYRVSSNKDLAKRTRRYARIDDELARRFLQAYYDTVDAIAVAPDLGSPWPTSRKRLANLRYRPVVGFENVLVFYRATATHLIVMRVLHTKQDISRIFPANGQS